MFVAESGGVSDQVERLGSQVCNNVLVLFGCSVIATTAQ